MTYHVLVSDAKVLDLETHGDPLESIDVRIKTTDAKHPDELVAAAEGADALVVGSVTRVTAELFEGVDSLPVVGRGGIGVDNIDVAAAAAHGVTVVNVPAYSLEEVSTHALGLLSGCLRWLGRHDRAVKRGEWDWSLGTPIHRFRDETVGRRRVRQDSAPPHVEAPRVRRRRGRGRSVRVRPGDGGVRRRTRRIRRATR